MRQTPDGIGLNAVLTELQVANLGADADVGRRARHAADPWRVSAHFVGAAKMVFFDPKADIHSIETDLAGEFAKTFISSLFWWWILAPWFKNDLRKGGHLLI